MVLLRNLLILLHLGFNQPFSPILFSSSAEVNVKDLGAKGDGTTDDFAIIQKAIDDFEVIKFPKGVYIINNPLKLKTGSRLIGKSGVVIKAGPGFPNPLIQKEANLINIYSAEHITIERIEFDFDGYQSLGDNSYANRSGACVRIYHFDSSSDNVEKIKRKSGFTFNKCIFKNTRIGLSAVNHVENIAVRECSFLNFINVGMDFNQSYEHDVLKVKGSGSKGGNVLKLDRPVHIKRGEHISIEGIFDGKGGGLAWKSVKKAEGNTIELFGTLDIEVKNAEIYKIALGHFPKGLNLSDCIFDSKGSRFGSVWLSGCKDVVVENCEIRDVNSGIFIYVNDFGNEVENITIKNSRILLRPSRVSDIVGGITVQGISFIEAYKDKDFKAKKITISGNTINCETNFSKQSEFQKGAIILRGVEDVKINSNKSRNFPKFLVVSNNYRYKSGVKTRPNKRLSIQNNRIKNSFGSPYAIAAGDSVSVKQ